MKRRSPAVVLADLERIERYAACRPGTLPYGWGLSREDRDTR